MGGTGRHMFNLAAELAVCSADIVYGPVHCSDTLL